MTECHDPSDRFVLTEDAPYLANLAALWAADPKLAAAIEETDDAAAYRTTPSKSGEPTLSVTTSSGRRRSNCTVATVRSTRPAARRGLKLDGCVFCVHASDSATTSNNYSRSPATNHPLRLRAGPVVPAPRSIRRDYSKLIRSGRVLWFWREDKADRSLRLTRTSR